MRRALAAALLAVLAVLPACDDDDTDQSETFREYQVTIENLTDSQPFSPGVLVTHTPGVDLFEEGQIASEALRVLAEEGDPAPMVAELVGAPGVSRVVQITEPTHRGGGPGPAARVWRIAADPDVTRLSMAVMLICTNDGFTGIDSMILPGEFGALTITTIALDAGTEANAETYATLADACNAIGPDPIDPDGANDRAPTSEPIQAHPGIQGTGDLDEPTYDWGEPVARVIVQRVN